MVQVKLIDDYLDIDIEEELSIFDWNKLNITDKKWIACSPFREDSSPSFWVNLTGEFAGWFGDSAWNEERYRTGSFLRLLSFLRNESYEDTLDYLRSKYDYEYTSSEIELKADPSIDVDTERLTIPEECYKSFVIDKEYLPSRGIKERVIEIHGVFDEGKSIGIPWRGLDGTVRAIKHRKKDSKEFWYQSGGTPISNLVWGLDLVLEFGINRVAICEAEIDAMTWQSAGVYAIALGGASINDKQVDQIIQSGIETVILSGDNDSQGRKFNDRIYRKLKDYVNIQLIDYDSMPTKDVNELGVEGIKSLKLFRKKFTGLKL